MRRRGTAIFFLILGISLSALAVALNVGWILLNLRQVALLVFGVIFFSLIITGLIFNTIFLVREIRRNEQHDAFINAVTHELKTPIASIKLYLETLRARDMDRQQQLKFFDIMLADNERLLATVEQVLDAGRTREKKRELRMSFVDLGELITETVGIMRDRKHLDEHAIRFTPPERPVTTFGDRTELQTALLNLLDNAVKYSAGEPQVSVRLRAAGSTADIYIRDRGIGMASTELKRIFKRFYRVQGKGPSPTKGTGLGLAIVRSVIQKHGGRIRALSKGEGRGTTFFIQLPLSNH